LIKQVYGRENEPDRPAKNQLKRSWDNVGLIKKKAWEHRCDFLVKKIHRHKIMNKNKKHKAIQNIRMAERRICCNRIHWGINKSHGVYLPI
jgi:hypothetical protein